MTQTVVHVITALGQGGAEAVLGRLVSNPSDSKFEHVVVSLCGGDETLKARLEAAGVRVIVLGIRPGSIDPRMILKLARVLRREHPDVVQTWMYHADLVGGLAARLAGSPPVAWNIRNGTLTPAFSKRLTVLTARVNARVSRRLPKVIVCCAESAKQIHVELGFPADRIVVIPNGYDLDRFRAQPLARKAIRAAAGIPENALVIGMVARFHPQKDHQTFFAAAALVRSRFDNVHFLLCGDKVVDGNPELRALIEQAGVADRTHLLGSRDDIPAIQSSLDVACMASQGGEGFPNAVAEAMACETPCAVTDVGDAALIVGETGRVVPSGNAPALAEAFTELLNLSQGERAHLGMQARQRIADRYDIREFARRYEELYDKLAGNARSTSWAFGTSD